jgi:hypothetical protein
MKHASHDDRTPVRPASPQGADWPMVGAIRRFHLFWLTPAKGWA